MGRVKKEQLIEHLFRHEYGKMVSLLTHKFGPSYLESIEDAVQEALIKAMQVWGYRKIPDNPTAWLLRVASNRLIDMLRKEKKILHGDDALLLKLRQTVQKEVYLNDTINDSQLKMIFACCHPALSDEYQIVLSLKLIGGFGNSEIAKVLIKKEETVAKSFTRAKKRWKDHVKTLEIPMEIGLKSRLSVVLKVIYLLFTEGYAPNSGELPIKKDFCLEAIRLALLLSQNRYCDQPEVHALIALMYFHTSRFEARTGQNGEMVDLEHQNRDLYDQKMIEIGIRHLKRAGQERLPSNYHLQAAVSYYHCAAKHFANTDWKSILRLYDLQLRQMYSPIVQLNRIVPYHRVYGAKSAIKELQNFEEGPYFLKNTLFYALKATLLAELDCIDEAKMALQKAIAMTTNLQEEKHLAKKLLALGRR